MFMLCVGCDGAGIRISVTVVITNDRLKSIATTIKIANFAKHLPFIIETFLY